MNPLPTIQTTPNNWPNFQNSKAVDKEGNWSPVWQNLMQQFFQFAQTNLSAEGHVMPNQTTTNINYIASSEDVPDGTVWYNSTALALQVKINGVVKTIQVV